MSLVYTQSFDNISDPAMEFDSFGAESPTIEAGKGRFGTKALFFYTTAGVMGNRTATKNLPSQDTYIIGFSLEFPTDQKGPSGQPPNDPTRILAFMDGASVQVSLHSTIDGHLYLMRGSVPIGSQSFKALSFGIPHYIEMKLTVDDVSGLCVVRVNGGEWLNFQGDTQATVNPWITAYRFGQQTAAGDARSMIYYIDDVVIMDDGGTEFNDFIGDTHLEWHGAIDDGGVTQFTPSAGQNWECVDEIPPDEDATYNETATAGNKDLLDLSNILAPAGTIRSVVLKCRARQTDPGPRNMRLLWKSGASEAESGDLLLADGYQYLWAHKSVDPNTSVPWTFSGFNVAELGYKLQS